jgi:hypothetical protein
MKALALYAGPQALEHLKRQGLQAQDVRAVAAAAGGPKGLVLGPLDRFLFGHWLADSPGPVELIGASIGACRMATACLPDPQQAFECFEHDYIAQHYPLLPGERRPAASRVSAQFAQTLQDWFGAHRTALVRHPTYRLHVLAARGVGWLDRPSRAGTFLGFGRAYWDNLRSRSALAHSFERVVFSAARASDGPALPFDVADFPTTQVQLSTHNVLSALQASCAVPFALEPVHDIAGAPAGTYWDGGLVDYHLHLRYSGLVLYPHFQRALVPGWLDKQLRWRHRASAAVGQVLLLAPRPEWVASLPGGQLPSRQDFSRFARDPFERQRRWRQAVAASQVLADEWAQWLQRPDLSQVQPL